MINAFDRIVIAVPDLADAVTHYQGVLGADFWLRQGEADKGRAWLGLANVVIELCELPVAVAAIAGVVFSDKSSKSGQQAVHNSRDLTLHICDGSDTLAFRESHREHLNLNLAVDHLVLHTADPHACIQLFSVGLGIRLALDKTVPEWGGRMLFFRVGKLTLEVIARDKPEAGPDHFWGIAYRSTNITATAQYMEAGGVEVSSVRPGRKPGTKVATLKSHTLGIPTLLIEPAPRE